MGERYSKKASLLVAFVLSGRGAWIDYNLVCVIVSGVVRDDEHKCFAQHIDAGGDNWLLAQRSTATCGPLSPRINAAWSTRFSHPFSRRLMRRQQAHEHQLFICSFDAHTFAVQ